MNIASFPSPPTDNIYKFCALTGTIIMILSIYFPYKIINDMDIQINAAELKIEILKIDSKFASDKAEDTKKIIDKSTYQLKNKIPLEFSDPEIKQLMKDDFENEKIIQIKAAEIKSLIREAHRIRGILDNILNQQRYWLITGISLMLFGYLNWYFKIQRYEDKRIRSTKTK